MDIFHRRSFSEKKNRANRSHWVDLAGEFRYNVVTVLWIIRQILGGRSHGRERKLFVPLGIYFDFSRVRDWARECGGKHIQLEREVPAPIPQRLADMGHQVEVIGDPINMGRGQIIWKTDGGLYAGGTEPRCDGAVAAW